MSAKVKGFLEGAVAWTLFFAWCGALDLVLDPRSKFVGLETHRPDSLVIGVSYERRIHIEELIKRSFKKSASIVCRKVRELSLVWEIGTCLGERC